MKLLPVTLNDKCRQGSRLVLALWISLVAASTGLAEDDPTVPVLNKSLNNLDVGFRDGSWATSFGLAGPCRRPSCTTPSSPNPNLANPGAALPYSHDFSLSIKSSGPLSFRLSGNRLKMKVEF